MGGGLSLAAAAAGAAVAAGAALAGAVVLRNGHLLLNDLHACIRSYASVFRIIHPLDITSLIR